MTAANTSPVTDGLAPELKVAQNAIHLPEVQEMIRRLSEYNLGVYMPHMHDERTGQFQPIPDELIQVEDGLEVSFQSADKVAGQPDRFVPVGWYWRGGASKEWSVSAACKAVCVGTGPRHEVSHR